MLKELGLMPVPLDDEEQDRQRKLAAAADDKLKKDGKDIKTVSQKEKEQIKKDLEKSDASLAKRSPGTYERIKSARSQVARINSQISQVERGMDAPKNNRGPAAAMQAAKGSSSSINKSVQINLDHFNSFLDEIWPPSKIDAKPNK